MSFETKKIVLNRSVTSYFLQNRQCRTFSSQKKERKRGILSVPWAENSSSERALIKMRTKTTLMLRIRKRKISERDNEERSLENLKLSMKA